MSDNRAQTPEADTQAIDLQNDHHDHLTARGISDSIKGKAMEAKGAIEDAAGAITGDLKTEAKGKLDRAIGKARDLLGKTERYVD